MTTNQNAEPQPRASRSHTTETPGEKKKRLLQIIDLHPTDDMAVIRDHLRRAQGTRVVLQVPAACHALEREVALRKLARYATLFERNVALVTDNRKTKRLARFLGFPVFGTTRKAQTARKWSERWKPPKRPDIKKEIARTGERKRFVPGKRARNHAVPFSSGDSRVDRILTVLLFAFLVTTLVGGTFLIVPTAEVYLLPATVPVSVQVPVQADPDIERIDYKGGRIPGRQVEMLLEGSAESATTGREDVANARAGGRVVLINRTTEAVYVPQGTIVRASSGTPVRFRIVEEGNIPPGHGQRAVVAIEAVDPGPRGNVPALVINRIEGPLALSVQVVNNQPTSGGDVKQVATVTESDKNTLRELLLTRLQQEGKSALKEKLEAGDFLPPETVSLGVNKEVFDHAVDDQTETLHLTLRVHVRGLVISDVAAASLARQALHAQVPAHHQLQEETVQYSRGQVERWDHRIAHFTVAVSGQAIAIIHPSDVREAIAGRSLVDARKRLVEQFPLASDPLIQVTPGWLRHVPWLSFRVFVSVRNR